MKSTLAPLHFTSRLLVSPSQLLQNAATSLYVYVKKTLGSSPPVITLQQSRRDFDMVDDEQLPASSGVGRGRGRGGVPVLPAGAYLQDIYTAS